MAFFIAQNVKEGEKQTYEKINIETTP
jgi:hypothetical protein